LIEKSTFFVTLNIDYSLKGSRQTRITRRFVTERQMDSIDQETKPLRICMFHPMFNKYRPINPARRALLPARGNFALGRFAPRYNFPYFHETWRFMRG
jgi:hypothetical protein